MMSGSERTDGQMDSSYRVNAQRRRYKLAEGEGGWARSVGEAARGLPALYRSDSGPSVTSTIR